MKENIMLKHRLARRLSTLFMLVAVLVAVSSAPATHARGGVFCLDDGIGAYGCFGWVCCNEGACWCA
jgi:hypothetical protein